MLTNPSQIVTKVLNGCAKRRIPWGARERNFQKNRKRPPALPNTGGLLKEDEMKKKKYTCSCEY
jgi:hypothetical protein